MALEIERRFLVSGEGWREHVRCQSRLRQGYLLSGGPAGLTLRIRTSEGERGPQAWFTIKAMPEGNRSAEGSRAVPVPTRLEFEYPIPLEDAEALLALAPWQLAKSRCELDLPGGEWVVDRFEAPNAPLVIAEVELPDPDRIVEVPPWCGRELTGHWQLSNASLASRPLRDWPPEERISILGPGPWSD